MAKKAPARSALTGSWQIISLTSEAEEDLNEEGPAFIEFNEDGVGHFYFGSILGVMDPYRTKPWQGKRVAQFSWDGEDETDGTPLDDIGWVILDGEKLAGTISVFMGEDHEFVAERNERNNSSKKK
jgi:hypothetical protein